MRKEQECKTNECSSKRNLPTKEEIAEMREKLALQDNIGRGNRVDDERLSSEGCCHPMRKGTDLLWQKYPLRNTSL